jgi:hypothetical protein
MKCVLQLLNVSFWHIADSLSGLAARPLLGVKQTLPQRLD